jgi:hypothetical protein
MLVFTFNASGVVWIPLSAWCGGNAVDRGLSDWGTRTTADTPTVVYWCAVLIKVDIGP